MRTCDKCHRELPDLYGLPTCRKCLFAEALNAPDPLAETTGFGEQRSPDIPGVHGLFRRPDFYSKYEILERVAGGGQGTVWKVFDLELRRAIAMKRLSAEDIKVPAAVYRFLAEAQIASQLEHPGILPVYDVGLEPDGRPYYTTSLMDGLRIEDIWKEINSTRGSAWTVRRGVELLVRVCNIISYAHAQGVVHRDLKPSNILVSRFDDVRVIDWGSAHVMQQAASIEETFIHLNRQIIQTHRGDLIYADPKSPVTTGQSGLPFTPPYMPPELVLGENTTSTPALDVYALGVTLYQLLTGSYPFTDDENKPLKIEAMRERFAAGALPTKVRARVASANTDLAAICDKAIAREKHERYGSVEDFANDLRAFLEIRPVNARGPSTFRSVQKWAMRKPAYPISASVIIMVLVVAIAFAKTFRAERNAARQASALRGAELAFRSGHWKEGLDSLDEAERCGYNNRIDLGLQRAEAWTILCEPERSERLLKNLAARSDLGKRKGVVLLRLGEHELFDPATANEGTKHVRQALTLDLDPDDRLFARGLVADSTPEALDLFHQAIKINSFHHGAHRHSLGLEFLLGRQSDLHDSSRFFAAIYPDDPSPIFLESADQALHGQLQNAKRQLAATQALVSNVVWLEIDRSLPLLATAAGNFDPTNFVGTASLSFKGITFFKSSEGLGRLSEMAPPSRLSGRTPYLPCIQKGLLDGRIALGLLVIPSIGNIETAVANIKESWKHHPEALIPMLAGLYLESSYGTNGSKPTQVLQQQAELYQLAADSPSLVGGLDRSARYLATKSEVELLRINERSDKLQTQCVANLQQVLKQNESSTAELRAYSRIALELKEYDLFRLLLARWRQQMPQDAMARNSRINLDAAAADIESGCAELNRTLGNSPHKAELLHISEALRKTLADFTRLIDSAASNSNSPSGKL